MKKALIPILLTCALVVLASAAAGMMPLPFNMPMLPFMGLFLLVLEIFLPTKGFLGLIGMILFVYGTFDLADHPDPDLRLSMPAILGINAAMLTVVITMVVITVRGYTSGGDKDFDMIGRKGKIIDWNNDNRRVEIDGQIWQAASDAKLSAGQKVTVTKQEHLTLHVTPEN
jgi:membrane-bound ClpP family serine protease